MRELNRLFDRLARRVGGARVLALPLIRTLALLAAVAWLVLAPREYRQSAPLVAAVIGFFAYSLAVEASLWWRPAATLRLNFYVLLVDQAFALVLIYLTGGARSALYLALPLIAALLGLTGCDLRPGFSNYVVLSGLNRPTAIEFSPDGRVFVA